MAKITNSYVCGLERSIYRSGYPMRAEAPSFEEFTQDTRAIAEAIVGQNLTNPHLKRAVHLAKAKGGGHDQFLTGIIVDFDLCFSIKAWGEAERYTFLNFVSSMSTMHRIAHMSVYEACNAYVSEEQCSTFLALKENYDVATTPESRKEAYLQLLYNIPTGFELTAGMSTNYRCLKNIYHQRRHHRLPDWQVFCDWVETLPLAEYLITNTGVDCNG